MAYGSLAWVRPCCKRGGDRSDHGGRRHLSANKMVIPNFFLKVKTLFTFRSRRRDHWRTCAILAGGGRGKGRGDFPPHFALAPNPSCWSGVRNNAPCGATPHPAGLRPATFSQREKGGASGISQRSRCPKTTARSLAPPSRARRSRGRSFRPSTGRSPCGSCRRRPFRDWSRP